MRGTCTGSSPGATGLGVNFAHRSERRFARILDFYRLRWEYEPHTFPLRWSADGRAVESFTPDFWLPQLGTYLELTTVRQSLSRKNRKLRRFRELHPDKRVRVLYRRDLESLMAKYGQQRRSAGGGDVEGGPRSRAREWGGPASEERRVAL